MKIPFILLAVLVVITFSGFSQGAGSSLEDYTRRSFTDPTGKEIVEVVVPGKPPAAYRAPVAEINKNAVILGDVPAFSWSFGCSPTATAMAAGFYDLHGYTNMYAGPTNGGSVPLDNSSWGSAVINGETRDLCPLSATRLGLDGRVSRGHVDDYWILYGNNDTDPFITNGWTEHSHGDCTADFMGTNQSVLGNSDGSTSFVYYVDGSPIYDYSGGEPGYRDGCHGIRLFYQSRGYTVIQNYTQLIYGFDGNTLGFTFDQYKNEIMNGRPVLIQVAGHTMLGFGFDDATQTVYLHDTWDYSTHSMTWGGSYSGMAQWGVTVVELYSPFAPPIANFEGVPTSIVTGSQVNFTDLSSGNPTSWQWSFPGGIPSASTLQNPTITYNVPGVYPVTLVASNANGPATMQKTGYITVTDPWYCAASAACDEYISKVVLGSINNSSGCGTNGYTDFRNLATNLVVGQSYSLTVTNGNPVYGDDQCGAWVDWNQDFDFDDAGEFLSASGSPGSGPYTLNFTVPVGTIPGSKGLRVRILYTGPITPCGQVEWGETEDYTVNILPNLSSKVLSLKVFLQGLYDVSSGIMNKVQDENGDHFGGEIAEQITVKLAQSSFPYSIVAQSGSINLYQDGTCTSIFPSTLSGSYYIVVFHRNSITTWSSSPVNFSGSVTQYNFTLSNANTLGGNSFLKGGKYCFYGGDVNQDNIVDSGDMIPIDNLSSAFGTGYLAEDVNGDGLIDSGDMIIVDNNAALFIGTVAP